MTTKEWLIRTWIASFLTFTLGYNAAYQISKAPPVTPTVYAAGPGTAFGWWIFQTRKHGYKQIIIPR